MTISEELERIPPLTAVGTALVQFAKSLTSGGFIQKGKLWVYAPANFVAFSVQHARAQTIRITFYGNWRHFKESPVLQIERARNTMYCACTIDNPRQLAAAARYIEKAFNLHSKSPRQKWKYALATA